MRRRFCTHACLFFTALACVTDNHPIAHGTYIDPSGAERIVIQGSKIHFHIKLERNGTERSISRTYNYSVQSDGTIVPYAMTSSEAAFGIGWYDWFWDGENIVRLNPKTGESLKFSRGSW